MLFAFCLLTHHCFYVFAGEAYSTVKSLRLEELVKEVRVGVEAFGVAVFITAATPVGKFVCLVASL